MLLYSNYTFWRIVFGLRGSVIWKLKNLMNGGFVAVMTFVLLICKDQGDFWFVNNIIPPNNLGWNMMGGTIVFAVVFRTSLGWQRYWEAMTQLQSMYSKWTDAYTQCHAFFNVTFSLLRERGGEDADTKKELLIVLHKRLRDRFSLLSALAAHRLTHGDVQRMDMRALTGVSWSDQVVLRREMRIGEDLTDALQLPRFHATEDLKVINSEKHLENDWTGEYTVTGKISDEEIRLLDKSADRVNAVMYWIVHDLTLASSHLCVAPPIQSRMFQEMSNGCLAMANAIKISDVPFPFQFSQLFNLLVCAFTLFIPLYSAVFTESLILSPMLAFVVHQTLCVINHVAQELETPFGTEANDLSLRDFHARFLETIIELEGCGKYKKGEPIDPSLPNYTTIDGVISAKKTCLKFSPREQKQGAGFTGASSSTEDHDMTELDDMTEVVTVRVGSREEEVPARSLRDSATEEHKFSECEGSGMMSGDVADVPANRAEGKNKATKKTVKKAKDNTPKEKQQIPAGEGLTINVYSGVDRP